VTIPITVGLLRATYALLNETPPFSKWNLPDADDVAFHVAKGKAAYGRHWHDGVQHHLEISSGLNGSLRTLIETMAHEMIHVHERQAGTAVSGVAHSRAFQKWASQVCKAHGFDPKPFV